MTSFAQFLSSTHRLLDSPAESITPIRGGTGHVDGTSMVTDWVEITNSGSDSIVKVDRDGTGSTYSMTQICRLTGINGLTNEAQLRTDGKLVRA